MADEQPRMNDSTMPPPPPQASSKPGSMGPPAPVRVRSLGGDPKAKGKSGKVNPRQRAKQGRKGFGLHDWALLSKQAKDLAQRKGAPLRQISREELAEHCHVWDGWCALKGKVYNISPYLAYHPGGESIMHKTLGTDASKLFDKYHRWVNIEGLIGSLQIGYLDTGLKNGHDDGDSKGNTKAKPPVYMTEKAKQDEFAVPAPIVTKSKAKDMANIMPPKTDATDDIEEDYTEPWES